MSRFPGNLSWRKRFPIGQPSRKCHVRAILWRLYPAPFLRDRPPSSSSRFMLISSIRLLPLALRFQPSSRVLCAGRTWMKDNIYVPFILFAYHIARCCIRAKMCRESHCRRWTNKTPQRFACISLSDPFRMKYQRLKQHWINFDNK